MLGGELELLKKHLCMLTQPIGVKRSSDAASSSESDISVVFFKPLAGKISVCARYARIWGFRSAHDSRDKVHDSILSSVRFRKE